MSTDQNRGRSLYDVDDALPEDDRDLSRSLGDDGPAATRADTTPKPSVDDFDAVAFVAGMRPYREATLLQPGGDLIARARRLGTRIQRMADDDPALDDAIDEFERMRAEFREGGVWWEVEARSSDWVRRTRAEVAKRRRIALPDPSTLDDLSEDDRLALLLDQLIGQIVTPSNATRELLDQMVVTSEREVEKLLVAMTFVNNRSAQEADVFGVDFSQRRSANRSARRSPARSKSRTAKG